MTVELKAEAARCATTHTPQPGSPPSQVTVKCNAGQAQPRSPGYLLHVYRGYDWLGAVDSHMATGTVTSWRIVNIANRDYLEMMVGW